LKRNLYPLNGFVSIFKIAQTINCPRYFLSPWWERIEMRGINSFVHPHPCLSAGRLTLPYRETVS
jgi:hypothetical protein